VKTSGVSIANPNTLPPSPCAFRVSRESCPLDYLKIQAGFRPDPAHPYTLVALVHDDGTAARAAGADHVVRLPFDPGAFVDELLAVMK